MGATVLVDVRLYEGAPNILAPNHVPYLQSLARILPKFYPERLKQLVVYPMPFYATPLWAVVSRFLDDATRKKILLLKGQVNIGAPCPADLGDIVDVDRLP